MVNKKNWLGILGMMLVFTMTVVGCASSPSSFTRGSGGDTSVLLRKGISFEQAFREIIFVLSRNGFDPEMLNQEAGYIRTRWNTMWYESKSLLGGTDEERYRVRILINFSPDRTQVIIAAPAESRVKGNNWVVGYDTRAIETLRNDLTQSIGN